MIKGSVARGGGLLVLGAVRGLTSEAPPVLAELTSFRPAIVAVSVSFDELTGLTEHFVGTAAEPVVPLTETESAEVRALGRFGEVRVPNPAVLAALTWAKARDVPVEAVDPSDEQYASLFTDHISYFELVRRTVRERKLTRDPPKAGSPDELAIAWHARRSPGRGSRSFDAARESAVCEATLRLSTGGRRVALLVDRERFDAVLGRLQAPAEPPDGRRPSSG